VDDKNDTERYEQKHKRDPLAEFYEEKYTCHTDDEEDSSLFQSLL